MATLGDMGVSNIDVNSWNTMGMNNFTVLIKDKEGKYHSDTVSVRWDKPYKGPLAGLIRKMVMEIKGNVSNANTSVE